MTPAVAARGSSPRGRGKPCDYSLSAGSSGLIPAWAGKTRRSVQARYTPRAHPRVGGENITILSPAWPSTGSSPRGRGKQNLLEQGPRHDRLIPAWAGKTRPKASATTSATAHPRVGGENTVSAEPTGRLEGSSPRGRGKPRLGIEPSFITRLIPAWAGKTTRRLTGPRLSGAHPRVGGENHAIPQPNHTHNGSSPRGRGKLGSNSMSMVGNRLIPAWAGKTT